MNKGDGVRITKKGPSENHFGVIERVALSGSYVVRHFARGHFWTDYFAPHDVQAAVACDGSGAYLYDVSGTELISGISTCPVCKRPTETVSAAITYSRRIVPHEALFTVVGLVVEEG